LKVARAVVRRALIVTFVFLALAPASVLAFSPPDPNRPGHHYGEYLHNPHLLSSAPTPGPGIGANKGGGTGIQNAFGMARSGSSGQNASILPPFQFQATPLSLPALTGGFNVGQDAWLVVIMLASLLAANVVLGVLYVARGGNYVYRHALLRPAPVIA
jgi:hypothetical protein